MYVLLWVVLLATSVVLLSHGWKRRSWWEAGAGALLLVATPSFFGVLSLWGDLLWFESLGFDARFWTALSAKVACATAAGAIGMAAVWLLTLPIPKDRKAVRYWPEAIAALLGGLWGLANWSTVLQYWYRVPAGVSEPIFGRDVSFFLFELPLFQAVASLFLLLAIVGLVASLLSMIDLRRAVGATDSQALLQGIDSSAVARGSLRSLGISGGVLLCVLACRAFLSVFGLLYSNYGVVNGAGWTDVYVRRPAYYVLAVLLLIGGLALIVQAFTQRVDPERGLDRRRVWKFGLPVAVPVLGWLFGLILLPGLFQWLHVQPNELSVEKPFIEHNIRLTRRAFDLHEIQEKEFPVSPDFTRQKAEDNRQVLSQVRLWDPRALDSVYEQFQEIRLYYEFVDVDVDRYTIDNEYRQVMVSPREMAAIENLPRQNQTFVNRHFKYTHGYGLTMAPVSEFTAEGLPNLLIKDLPPKSTSPDIDVQRPEIYFGELTNTYVVGNTEADEFDYPSGDHNVYNQYSGSGGVELSSFLRKFAFGWKLGGTRLLVSKYLTPESRILFHRQVHERVRKLAPFLRFDRDAYLVLDEGRLYWIIDAYTVSRDYPYSEPFLSEETTSYQRDERELSLRSRAAGYLRGVNYVRNSVKVVVDAFNGSADFYVFEPEDPLIQVWRRIFPDLFKDQEQLSEGLRAHVRYPEGLLLVQGMVYARYHMTDPNVFYNQEDVWVRATEKYYADVQPVEPYYVMWQPPDQKGDPEFIVMQPFTPKNRQVLIGWIAGMCDGENYGRLLAYRFPKEKRILGTQQVETKIDQDPALSKQLSLWDQRGSRVVRGNVLAIPVEDTLLYVEPIYLQAEAAAYPELRIVAIMHDDQLSYGNSFEKALAGLYGDVPSSGQPPQMIDRTLAELVEQAGGAFDGYLQSLGDKEFDRAAQRLEELSTSLEQLRRAANASPDEPRVAREQAP